MMRANHAKEIMKRFGLNTEDEVMGLIQEGLKKGEYSGINSDGFHVVIYNKGGKKLKTVISATDSAGSIQSAYPD